MDTFIRALYDYSYQNNSGREIALIRGEKFLLLEKSNADWWKCLRDGEHKPMYVPANYVEVITNSEGVPVKTGKHAVKITLGSESQDIGKIDQNANSHRSLNTNPDNMPTTPVDDVFTTDSFSSDGGGKSVESLEDASSDVAYVNLSSVKNQLSAKERADGEAGGSTSRPDSTEGAQSGGDSGAGKDGDGDQGAIVDGNHDTIPRVKVDLNVEVRY